MTNLDSSPFLGRLALVRIFNGTLKKGQTVAWARHDGEIKNVRISELLATKALGARSRRVRWPRRDCRSGRYRGHHHW